MDTQTLLAATDRLTKITSTHGSPSHLLNMTALNAYYDYLPLFEKPFVEDLLEALSEKFNTRKRLFGSQLTVSREDMETSMIEVNAFYAAMFHTIVIKTGLIQPPLIDLSLPDVVSYGGLGRMIGHELDAWEREFHSRLDCLSTQINEAANSRTLGNNTLDESFADSAGMEKAILAYKTLPKGPTHFGYTQDQMFFEPEETRHARRDRHPTEGKETWHASGLERRQREGVEYLHLLAASADRVESPIDSRVTGAKTDVSRAQLTHWTREQRHSDVCARQQSIRRRIFGFAFVANEVAPPPGPLLNMTAPPGSADAFPSFTFPGNPFTRKSRASAQMCAPKAGQASFWLNPPTSAERPFSDPD
ncbi:hypothetical protein HPB47_006328 [Ixodes persulcatus]|uniref:Uncharacterized protein n=1 Tax=Ixodes persulcatus TaxID=34615 RepID=A0AC60PBJ5_IXOPE|nr:hypothetical protein HPB47_006328 [Ixodes persulcatus]